MLVKPGASEKVRSGKSSGMAAVLLYEYSQQMSEVICVEKYLWSYVSMIFTHTETA